jgi:hypothetical protein
MPSREASRSCRRRKPSDRTLEGKEVIQCLAALIARDVHGHRPTDFGTRAQKQQCAVNTFAEGHVVPTLNFVEDSAVDFRHGNAGAVL